MAKKRNPQDATLRNIRAVKKALKDIDSRLCDVEAKLGALIHGGVEEVTALMTPPVAPPPPDAPKSDNSGV